MNETNQSNDDYKVLQHRQGVIREAHVRFSEAIDWIEKNKEFDSTSPLQRERIERMKTALRELKTVISDEAVTTQAAMPQENVIKKK